MEIELQGQGHLQEIWRPSFISFVPPQAELNPSPMGPGPVGSLELHCPLTLTSRSSLAWETAAKGNAAKQEEKFSFQQKKTNKLGYKIPDEAFNNSNSPSVPFCC